MAELNIPKTTLFLIISLDGKISTGNVDELDVDKDYRRIVGVKEGQQQYYDLEKHTDRVSLNSGRVMAKVGFNEKIWEKDHENLCFAVIDNKPHLTKKGTEYLARRSKTFYLITSNKIHPAFELKKTHNNIEILYYEKKVDFVDAFIRLKKLGVKRMTIQTGGELNAQFLRLGLVDRVSIVIAPCLIGGKDTQSLIGGESLHTQEDLLKIKALKLVKNKTLKNSYIHLIYKVINSTIIQS